GAGEERQPGPTLARLEELADSVRATGMNVHLHREGTTDGLPAGVDLAAYRIVQEALTNTLRHAAGADEVSVRVTAGSEAVEVSVVDNGHPRQGARPGGPTPAGAGRGLMGMRERVRLVGGSLRAGPLATGGFEVAAHLPVERTTQHTAEGTGDRRPEHMAEGTGDRRPDRPAEGTVDGRPDRPAEGTVDGPPQHAPEGPPQRTPQRTPIGTPQSKADSASRRMADGAPEAVPESVPEDMAQDLPDGKTDGTPEGTADGTPDGRADGTAEGGA
ncbi:sensor histidine kinase, partial [Streptomyces sp. IBSBF 3136]|uniref:sensor histidine kinase n=1 Tax=Streptomyces sp. IBSBF 3136 TaxID=2903524 RepID=UPI002FDBB95C